MGDKHMSRMGGMGGFGGMGDIQKLMKQAQKIQEETAKFQEDLEVVRFTASAGGNMVTVTVNGHGQVTAVKIDPGVVDPADVEILEDLIVTAARDASSKAKAEQDARLEQITGGLGGLNLPPGLL
jgi:DNA-binding YbaB/EbfC family protein